MVIHSRGADEAQPEGGSGDCRSLPAGGHPAACDGAGFGHIALCPETMGKINQLGDLDEVLELCTLDERLIPCIDFGHLYARSLGADDGREAFARMLDRVGGGAGDGAGQPLPQPFLPHRVHPKGARVPPHLR